MKTMRAWAAGEYGKPDSVLKLTELPIPTPKGNQVLLRVLCSSLNPIDLRMTQGYGARLRRLAAPQEFPFITGRDVVGEVVELGPDAQKFKTGDRVVGITGIKEVGAHSEYTAVDETNLTSAPDGISASKLAAIPYVGLTTWTALAGHLGFDPENSAGKHLFVHAGSGGVGSFTIQWAHALGMKVSTTCGPSNVDWVRELGADTVVNYAKDDYRSLVRDVDYAYDTLGGEYEAGTVGLVARGGGYVSIVHQLMPYTDRFGLVLGGIAVAGQLLRTKISNGLKGRKYAWSICKPNEAGIEHIMNKVENRQIRAIVEKELPMKDILAGYAHLASGKTKGKVVLRWDS